MRRGETPILLASFGVTKRAHLNQGNKGVKEGVKDGLGNVSAGL